MSQNTASRVGEIFTAAGMAFTRLGELAMTLHNGEQSPATGRWDADDVEQLRASVKRFGEDLSRISDNIKSKTIAQLKTGIKRKAVDDAKITGTTTMTSSDKKPVVGQPQVVNQRTPPTKIVKISPSMVINNATVETSSNEEPTSSVDNHDQLSNSLVQVKSCN